MSQIFNLQLATDTLSKDAQQLGVSIEQLRDIRIQVKVTLVQTPTPHLWLTYYIQLACSSLAAQLDWPSWKQSHVNFADYLWQQTCLECFIAGSITTDNSIATDYIEINVSPSGHYALYQFDNYRTPSYLPPPPLLQTNSGERAYISWIKNSSDTPYPSPANIKPLSKTHNTNWSRLIFVPCFYYKRSFSIALNQLSPHLFTDNIYYNSIDNKKSHDKFIRSISIERLHPCVILWFGSTALYFASNHASPADFHQRRYWSRFDKQMALVRSLS